MNCLPRRLHNCGRLQIQNPVGADTSREPRLPRLLAKGLHCEAPIPFLSLSEIDSTESIRADQR